MSSQSNIDFTKAPEGTQKVEMSVTYCTSENDVHRANNVLLEDRFRIWQTKEKLVSAVIELQFPNEVAIRGLDICNAGSAFIEVLVGQSNWESTEFLVLLPLTNFMNSSQSTNKVGRNQIKRFEFDQLCSTRSRKWEKIRVVCTQPFEPDEIGLSCLSVYVSDNQGTNIESSQNINNSSTLVKKPHRKGSGLSNSSNSTKSTKSEQPSTPPSDYSKVPETRDVIMGEVNPSIVAAHSVVASNPLPGDVIKVVDTGNKNIINNNNDDDETDVEEEDDNKNKLKISNKNVNNSSSNSIEKGLKKIKPTKDSDDTESDNESLGFLSREAKEIPLFSKLLNGVVMVIGGIINPEKGEIRDRAMEMGADYRPAWCREATHLVTPFEGTPKYLETKKAGGSIVRPDWIYDCYKQKVRLPIKNYQFEEMPKTPKTPEKKKSQVVSTTKKFKKKAIPDYDDSDDDSHIPNQFDFSDGFLVRDSDASDVEENNDKDSDDEENYDPDQEYGGVKKEDEDLDDLFKDGNDYLKRTFGFKGAQHLSKHDKNHPKKKLKLDNNNNTIKHSNQQDKDGEKIEEEVIEIKNKNYRVKDSNTTSLNQPKEKESNNNKTTNGLTLTPKTNTPPPSQSSQYKDSNINDNTQKMSPDQINKEINRLIMKEKLKHSSDSSSSIVDEEMKPILSPNSNVDDIEEKKEKKPLYKPTRSFLTGKEYIIDPLPTFFDGIEFYISVKDETSRKILNRIIIAYKGSITNTPKPSTRFVITDKTSWDKLFDITLSKFPNILFVPPSFIQESNDHQSLLPVTKFLIEKKK